VEADFQGGEVSSDGGLLLLREVDRRMGLTRRASAVLADERQPGKVSHDATTLLRQRVFALGAGWEDLNDAPQLRCDSIHQVAAGSDSALASASTLCRFENAQSRATAVSINRILVDTFIAAHAQPPAVITLDFDATDAPTHGRQEGRFFHGYYDHYCFLPLYVFCGDHLLVAYLRGSNADGARHSAAILKLLVQRIRQVWPRTKIVMRADSGFCRDLMLTWCDRHNVKYLVGIARNSRLQAMASELMGTAAERFEQTGEKQRWFTAFDYAAGSWRRQRRVIAKAEHSVQGSNPRFIVTNLVGDSQKLYDRRYCARGEMENRIKEQMMLFADRVSAHRWWANQWRLLLSALAYTLIVGLRRLALSGTALARATCATLRLKLVKIGAVIVRSATSVRIHLSSHHPCRDIFLHACGVLSPPH
tara:strand:- start:159 stop:1418 length:1260 start_codon:yes stop_codon:yes gene_type:complete